MIEQWRLLPDYLWAHLHLTLLSLFVGIIISIPLGIFASRIPRLERFALAFASIIQTIPSLALLAIMVPLLNWFALPSIGFWPAFLALVFYSILPVARATVVGINSIDGLYIESAKSLGMSSWQRLFLIELPLARPVIIAGIRTATVWTTGAATLATAVGANSLGNFIFVGLQTQNIHSVLVGCIAAAGLALALDSLVHFLSYSLEAKKKPLLLCCLFILSTLFAVAFFGLVKDRVQSPKKTVVGAKAFTEQYILSEIIAQKLAGEKLAYPELRQSLSSLNAYEYIKNGHIDILVDYTATLWHHVMQRSDPPHDAHHLLREIENFLAKDSIRLVGKLGFKNSYVFAMPEALANELGIGSLSDMANHKNLRLGSDFEFFGRNEWKLYQSRYGLEFSSLLPMEHALMYQAVRNSSIDVIVAFSTDGLLKANTMRVLKDDLEVGLAFDAVLLVNGPFAHKNPRIIASLKALTSTFSDELMRSLNFEVDSLGRSPRYVAKNFISPLNE